MLKLYNSLTREKEIFKPLKDKKVSFYVCGPTVYGPGHLGHARTYIAFDIIRRYLEYKGFKVKYVMNITDVHDDIIKKAEQEKTDIFSLSKKYTNLFLRNQKQLGIKKADYYLKVSEHIKEIKQFIISLEKKGFAYEQKGSVYFNVSKFKDYGKLSGIKPNLSKTGTRVQTDKYERDEACDFVLWKKAKPKEPSWQSPWGKGRPGWHIECSAMSQKYLGQQIDIHGGAKDLKFPHHENEIAQSEAKTGKKPFVKYWLHAGLLNIKGQKMSKSLKNFIVIQDVLKKWDPRVIRMFVTSSHYRSSLNWTEKNILQAKQGLERIEEFIEKIKTLKSKNPKKIDDLLSKTKKDFEKAMDDDFNSPQALASIFEMIKEVNRKNISNSQTKKVVDFLKEIDKVFNFLIPEKKEIPEDIKKLVKEREKYRKEKNFKKSDELRKKIAEKGFEIKDTANGTTIKK
jgi:cysteinyl-tRNA synthetase